MVDATSMPSARALLNLVRQRHRALRPVEAHRRPLSHAAGGAEIGASVSGLRIWREDRERMIRGLLSRFCAVRHDRKASARD